MKFLVVILLLVCFLVIFVSFVILTKFNKTYKTYKEAVDKSFSISSNDSSISINGNTYSFVAHGDGVKVYYNNVNIAYINAKGNINVHSDVQYDNSEFDYGHNVTNVELE